jgi:inner membrane protein
VGWFEPFLHQRISFNAVYVVDIFFSVVPGIAALILLILPRKNQRRKFWWKIALICPLIYLFYCLGNKIYIQQKTKKILAANQIPYDRLLTTPAPLQNWLWFVAAGNDTGFYTGYISVFDKGNRSPLAYSPVNGELLASVKDKLEVVKLLRFSQGFYTVEKHADTILFNDLRFGQVTGWADPHQRFAFSYILQPEADNTLVVQKGRFANWNKATFNAFIRRIRGKYLHDRRE